MIIAARCPTGASVDVKNMWSNCLAAVDDVRAEDEQQEDAQGLVSGPTFELVIQR